MKKLFFLMILFIPLAGTAQQKMWLGPEVGLSVIEISNDQIGRTYQPGLFGGAIFEYRFNNWFGIKTGINYAQKRQAQSDYDTTAFSLPIPGIDLESLLGEGTDLNTYSETHSRYSQHYLEMPIFAKFNWKEYYVAVGGFVGYQLSATRKEQNYAQTPFAGVIDLGPIIDLLGQPELAFLVPEPSSESFSSKKSKTGLSNFDFGIKASIGYQSDNFGFNATYQFGIPDYRSSPSGKTDRHQYMQFSINYLFGLGKGKASSSSL